MLHRERSLKAAPWSGCLAVFGLVLYSTTLLAAEGGDVDPPSAEATTEKERVTLPEMTVTAAPGRDHRRARDIRQLCVHRRGRHQRQLGL